MALHNPVEIRTWLDGVDYPATRDALVETARRNQAPEHVQAALRAIPATDYANREEVLAATPLDSAQTDAEKAQENRHHTHSGLAEAERDTPANPIVDELGENRGS